MQKTFLRKLINRLIYVKNNLSLFNIYMPQSQSHAAHLMILDSITIDNIDDAMFLKFYFREDNKKEEKI